MNHRRDAGLRAAGEDLVDAGFSIDALARMLGRELRGGMLSLFDLAQVISAQGMPEKLATLARLWLGAGVAGWRDVERCFRKRALDALLAIGALERDGADARARLRVVPFHRLSLLVDRPDAPAATAVRDPDRSTSSLAPWTLDRRGQRALDVGCGSGVLAILAARTHRRVLAVDLNPHAIELTRWNAALNGARLDTALCPASSFDGLPERQFELVTFAMPFLLNDGPGLHERSPTGARVFDDTYGGLARVLAPRGRGVLWHQIETSPGALERRLADVPAARELAVVWNGPIREGIGWEMGRAIVTRRRRADPAVVRVPVPQNATEGRQSDRQGPREVARYLATMQRLADRDLDTLIPRVEPYVTASRTWSVTARRLRAAAGVTIGNLEVSPAVLTILETCDGRTVRAIARRSGHSDRCRAVIRQLAVAGVISLSD